MRMSSVQKNTREQILEYLSAHPVASAAEMAAALGVTAANIRHHLGLLQARGLVTRTVQRRSGRRGRPVNLYRLTTAAQQPFLEPLTRALLEALRAEGADAFVERLCVVVCDGGVRPHGRTLRERLQHAMRQLEGWHFEPRWEAHRYGPRVVFHRCPYAPLVADYPELCRLDALMLEHLLGAPVEPYGERGTPCEFIVRTGGRKTP